MENSLGILTSRGRRHPRMECHEILARRIRSGRGGDCSPRGGLVFRGLETLIAVDILSLGGRGRTCWNVCDCQSLFVLFDDDCLN